MTCVSQTAPLASPGGISLPHAWLALWRRYSNEARLRRHLATLDDRALRDLGLTRDVVDPPRPCDPAGLWLNRIPG